MATLFPPHQRVPLWRDVRVLSALGQAIFVVVIIIVGAFLYGNVRAALQRQGLVTGFDFMRAPAGFNIGDGPAFEPSESYARAFTIGVINTLRVIGLGIVLATMLGLVAGVARLSSNWLVAKIAAVYVQIIRNTPLLLQLFFWFFAVILKLPNVRNSITLPGPIYMNVRGIYVPWATPTETFGVWRNALIVGAIVAGLVWLGIARWERRTGRVGFAPLYALAAFALMAAAGWFVLPSAPLTPDVPTLRGLNYRGGARMSPEYAALLFGLVFYTGAFIAEIVRAGIQAVSKGQVEAARALGLRPLLVLRLVVFPQALRVIIPPLTSQYLNLAKNSSLAVAIGYPDLFSIGGTIFNQTGHALEIISLIMLSYLTMSLTTSLLLNLYNRRVRLVER
ncbi:MAG: polar amino acid ABC transporter, inner rane subunit [Anaerolineales bacterium]|nr:polar amino acid ABC transporter, inner rane subunit [Anaerolineales bacterium]